MAWLSKDTLDVVSKPATRRARRRVIAPMELEVHVGDRSEGRADAGEAPAGHRGPADQLERRVTDARGPADQWAKSVQTLGKTESWEIDAKSAQLQEKLQQVTDAHKSAQLQEKLDLEDDGTLSKLETEMKQAIGTGVVNMRGHFGRYFYREIKIDKRAEAEFTACGKNYDKQRAFKAKFAETSYHDMLEQKRTKTEQTFNLQSVDAEYCGFSRIVSREGGDLPAFEAAKVFVRHAMLAWQGGKLFHGHPWVKHDHMRGGAVVLHYREKISSGAVNIWDLATSEITTSAPHVYQQVENASDAPKPDDEEKEKPEEPIPKKSRTNPTGAAAGAAALAKFRANAAAAKDPAAAAAAEAAAAAAAAGEESAKKNMQAALRKAAVLKLEVSKATQAGNDILTLVAQNEDWSWCNCDALLAPVRRCLILVEDWKNPPSSGKHGHSRTTCPFTPASTSSRTRSSQRSRRRTMMSRVA
jgi:hypothetical protein